VEWFRWSLESRWCRCKGRGWKLCGDFSEEIPGHLASGLETTLPRHHFHPQAPVDVSGLLSLRSRTCVSWTHLEFDENNHSDHSSFTATSTFPPTCVIVRWNLLLLPHHITETDSKQSRQVPLSPEHRRGVLDDIKINLGDTYNDLYSISSGHFAQARGTPRMFFQHFSSPKPYHSAYNWLRLLYAESALMAVKTEFPEHHWRDWCFASNAPKTHWGELKNILLEADPVAISVALSLLEDAQEAAGVEHFSDWNRVSTKPNSRPGESKPDHSSALSRLYFAILQLGGLSNLLLIAYPNYQWDVQLLSSRVKKSVQHEMRRLMRLYFSDEGMRTYTFLVECR